MYLIPKKTTMEELMYIKKMQSVTDEFVATLRCSSDSEKATEHSAKELGPWTTCPETK